MAESREALVNPALLKWARATLNLDVEEAARRIGVKAERLLDWEAGNRRPTLTQAREMARVYRRPLASFYLPKPPGEMGFSVPHDYRRFPDQVARPLSPELITELRRIQYLRQAAIDLAEEAPIPVKFIATAKVTDSIQDTANAAAKWIGLTIEDRSQWNNPYDALNGWRSAIESLGVLVMHLDHVELDELRGVALAESVFPLIAVNGKDAPNGRVFTLIHEFVHLMLGASGLSDLRILERPRTADESVEQFCNAVAGEVLVPTTALLNHELLRSSVGQVQWLDAVIELLASYFHVSREVVVRRLTLVERASLEFYQAKRKQYAEEAAAHDKRPGFLAPARRTIRAVGKPFMRIALDAFFRARITGSDLAELLGTRLKHLPEIEQLLEGRNVLTGGDR